MATASSSPAQPAGASPSPAAASPPPSPAPEAAASPSPASASPAVASPNAVSLTSATAVGLKSAEELYKLGYQDGLDGKSIICPDGADADGTTAYNKGYGSGMIDRRKASLLGRIEGDFKYKQDPAPELDELATLDMSAILDIVADLKKANLLDRLTDFLEDKRWRIGVAVLTLRPDLDEQWRTLLEKLQQDERDAILKRVPAGSYQAAPSGPPPGPATGKSDDDDDEGPTSGKVVVAPGGVQTQAKLNIDVAAKGKNNPAITYFKEIEATVTINGDGSFGGFDVDLKVVTIDLKKFKIPLQVEVSVKGASLASLANRGSIVGKVMNTIQTEISLDLKIGELKFSQDGLSFEIKLPKFLQ